MVVVAGPGQPASCTHAGVLAVKGLAYGYKLQVSMMGGPVNTRGYARRSAS